MFESETTINRFLLQYARNLMRDVPDERMAEQPLPSVNHAAWILGHLALSADWGVGALGGEKVLPAMWASHFGAGSTPTTARADYPSKSELQEMVEQQFERFRQQASTGERLVNGVEFARF